MIVQLRNWSRPKYPSKLQRNSPEPTRSRLRLRGATSETHPLAGGPRFGKCPLLRSVTCLALGGGVRHMSQQEVAKKSSSGYHSMNDMLNHANCDHGVIMVSPVN